MLKGEYYYGVKVHILGLRRPGTLPLPDYMGLTPASDHDLMAFRQIAQQPHGGELYLDKVYADEMLRQTSQDEQALTLLTLVRKAKGQPYCVFCSKIATDFTAKLPPILAEGCHPLGFRQLFCDAG